MLIQLLRCVVSFVPSVEQGTLSWAALFWNDHLCSRPLNFVRLSIIETLTDILLVWYCSALFWNDLNWNEFEMILQPVHEQRLFHRAIFLRFQYDEKHVHAIKKSSKKLDWRAWHINRNAILFPPIALQHDSNVIFSLRILQSLACLQSLTLFETAFHRKTLPYKLYIFSVYIFFVHQLVEINLRISSNF